MRISVLLLFFPALVFAAFPTERSSQTSQETSNTTTHTITLPATIESGDLLVVFSTIDNVTWNTFPAGWTQRTSTDHGTYGCAVYVKVADGTEDSTTLSPTIGS